MTDAHRPATPPPGSELALAAGCTCPVFDNRHGAGMYEIGGQPVYVMRADCPLHGVGMMAATDDDDEPQLV